MKQAARDIDKQDSHALSLGERQLVNDESLIAVLERSWRLSRSSHAVLTAVTEA